MFGAGDGIGALSTLPIDLVLQGLQEWVLPWGMQK
jgi:hypothetical protein